MNDDITTILPEGGFSSSDIQKNNETYKLMGLCIEVLGASSNNPKALFASATSTLLGQTILGYFIKSLKIEDPEITQETVIQALGQIILTTIPNSLSAGETVQLRYEGTSFGLIIHRYKEARQGESEGYISFIPNWDDLVGLDEAAFESISVDSIHLEMDNFANAIMLELIRKRQAYKQGKEKP